jgi:PST family polysaccharide transporter
LSTLAQQAVRGASWSIATSIGSRALGLVGTLAITHFLFPDVIGEVSDAFVIVTTVSQLSTWGFGQYLIAKPETGPDVAWHVTLFHVSLGIVALAAVLWFGGSFASWLHAPNLPRYVPGLVFSVFLDRICSIPERLIARRMRFRTLGLARTAGEIAYSVVTLALAIAGFGGMSIVWGNVARSGIRTTLMVKSVSWREWLLPHPLSRTTTRALLRFGLPFAVSSNAAFASRRWDNLVVSALFGPGILGSYNMAYNLADIPAVQVGEQIGDVLLPSFAQLNPEQRRDALVRATGLLGLVVFPLAVGLGAVAHTAIRALLPRAWDDVAPMLVVLSALSVTRPVGWTVASFLVARERTRALMFLGIFQVIVLLGSIVTLGKLGGPLWGCAGVGVAFGLYALACVFTVRADGVSSRALLGRCVRPLLACIPMVFVILAVRAGLHAVASPAILSLGVEIVAGAAGYVAGALLLAREQSAEFIRLIRKALKR